MVSGFRGRSSAFVILIFPILSLAVAFAHMFMHQAPLLPTILGQWLLVIVSIVFALAGYYGLTTTETDDERLILAIRMGAAYLFGAFVSLAYGSHQYFTPVAQVGIDTVFYDSIFTATTVGIAGVVIGLKSIQYEQTLDEATKRQKQLTDEQAFVESIFSTLPDVFYAFDKQGNFFKWNDRFEEVTGYDDDEISSMHPTDFIAEKDQAKVAEAIRQVFEDGETVTVEARFETKRGKQIPYEFTGAKITRDDGQSLGLIGIGRDISQKKKQRQRFEAVFNNTYQFIGLMDTEGRLLEANDTALEFGELDRDQVVGKKIWNSYWFQDNDEAQTAAREAVKQANEGQLYREEIEVQGGESTEMIDFSVRPIVDERGNITLLVPEGRLITDLKRRERHLQVLHRFLRHNLRNKMTVIQGTADVLERQLSVSKHTDHALQIERTAEELIELSETAHELSQVAIDSPDEQQPVDPCRLLEAVKDDMSEQYPSATIVLNLNTDIRVHADWRLEKVFEQLVENAIEHADEDPTVEIYVETDTEHVSINIADNGPGIPRDELAGIITDEEPTQLTHGTGFGLWLARTVIDDYGGDINYESRPGGGSILSIELQKSPSSHSVAGQQSELSNS